MRVRKMTLTKIAIRKLRGLPLGNKIWRGNYEMHDYRFYFPRFLCAN